MGEAYLGEIRMFAGDYAPQGWALCNGQLLSISEYDTLFALIGTTYGGDGQTNFALPDLQGRLAIHPSSNYALGANGGTETETLLLNQLPAHTHVPYASSNAGTGLEPTNAVWAATATNVYSEGAGLTPVAMSPQTVSAAGGNEAHNNMMPSLTISFIISLFGLYPPTQY